MNHLVPDFGMDDDYSIPTSSGLSRPRKSSMPDDEIVELLWQNGHVVMQSQNQRGLKKSPPPPSKILFEDAILQAEQSTSREIRSFSTAAPPPDDVSATHLFMQEDEMSSWLHYPLDDASFDRDFCADFLYPAPAATTTVADTSCTTLVAEHRSPLMEMAARPPMPPVRRTTEMDSSRFSNFVHFSRTKGIAEYGPSDSNKGVRETTVVDSSDTPAMRHDSRASLLVRSTGEIGDISGRGSMSGAAVAGTSSAGGGKRDMVTCDMTVTSSPSGSAASVSASGEPAQKPPAEDRKRKARQADDAECYSEDVEFEPADAKKQVLGSTSTKRSRAAEVHNLSERRRRDRINEKMKALQELIPRCNKSDKASMLDEAIEYLKSLQLQVQMMSMGCSMVPMMFPGVHRFMPPMGVGMGMGMGMDMSMSRPMMPIPSVLSGSAMPAPAAAAHLGPRFPMPDYHMQPVPAPDPSRIQATHQSDSTQNQFAPQNLNQSRVPNFADPYQQYLGLHQMKFPLPQNQAMAQPGTSKPSTSGGAENLKHHQSG